ncbi:MAG: hypothetical protein HY360_05690 [Verrucomicrobia bacterium]|nr:hypothetical protein [Verrucomicrobiota bacterium]
MIRSFIFFGLVTVFLAATQGAEVAYVEPVKPYKESPFLQHAKPRKVSLDQKTVNIPLITWAADGVMVSCNGGLDPNPNSKLARSLKLQAKLEVIDDFDKQVANYVAGHSPFLRGTIGMINLAAEALKELDPGLEPVVILQLSWSTGADGFVAKDIQKLTDLKGKTIVVQKNGPHVDLVQVLLQDAGLKPGDVNLKYVSEITFNAAAAKDGKAHDPANALRADPSLAGAACIFPDILTLTAGGKVGTGAEDSVKGARPILTTRTASRVIADVYAVRRVFFEEHKELVTNLVSTWLQEQKLFHDHLENIANKKSSDAGKVAAFKTLCKPLAGIFLQDQAAVNDYILWVGVDSELAGAAANAEFFGSPKNPVGFETTCQRIQSYYSQTGLIRTTTKLASAGFDYGALSGAAAATSAKPAKAPVKTVFGTAQEARKAAESKDASVLFEYTFKFPATMSELDWRQHKNVFETMHEKVTRYGGAVVQLRGHADNFFYNFVQLKRQKGETTYERRVPGTDRFEPLPLPSTEEVVNSANKLSYSRAFAVKKAYAQYLREALGLTPEEIDLSRFDAKGMGIGDPIHANPVTSEAREANMRGQMMIIAVESEIPIEFGKDDLK